MTDDSDKPNEPQTEPQTPETAPGEATLDEIDAEADRAAALAAAHEAEGAAEAGTKAEAESAAESETETDAERETEAEQETEAQTEAERKAEERSGRGDPLPELLRLLDLTAKYPEIGAPLAELAFKIGHGDIGERLVRMGLEGGSPGVEYYFVAANAARREGRYGEALSATLAAVRSFAGREPLDADEGARLLHLIRLGFSTLLFDLQDVSAHPEFVVDLAADLPALEERLGKDPFFHVMIAQTLWFSDRDTSEARWRQAIDLGEPEHTWNARGTWYKEAEKDMDKAERAYRSGLDDAPQSALLMHNLAQILVEKAGRGDVDVDDARRMLREADDLLRAALREEAPKGLRRHVHSTRDRLNALRSSLPPRGQARPRKEHGHGQQHRDKEHRPQEHRPAEAERAPGVGDVIRGRVVSLANYGAFISVGRGNVGLLHKSEIAHERIDDPASALTVGDEIEVKVLEIEQGDRGRLRIGLSRRALLPAPAGAERRDDRRDRRPPPRQDRKPQGQPTEKFLSGGKVSLGEMILAKIKEQEGK